MIALYPFKYLQKIVLYTYHTTILENMSIMILLTCQRYYIKQVFTIKTRGTKGRHIDKLTNLFCLYFWSHNKKGHNAEVDLIRQNGIETIPIEVKLGRNAHLRSIRSFMEL